MNFSGFLQSEHGSFSEAIIFIEDDLAIGDEFREFINKHNHVISFNIVCSPQEKLQSHRQYTIYMYSSPDDIYGQIKPVFEKKNLIIDETEGLTKREVDVLELVALGHSNKEIADKLFISTHTVMSHRKNITEKLGIKSISGLTVYAIINNIIDTTNLDLKDLI